MDSREHRIMLIHFSNALSRDNAVRIAMTYGLPASDVDKINTTRGSPGLELVTVLEQRLIISEDPAILNPFCQTLYDLHLDDLAAKIKKLYPDLPAKQDSPPEARTHNTSNPSEVTEGGGPLMQPASQIYIKQEDGIHQSSRQNTCSPHTENSHHQSTDVTDTTLSKLSECIGGEWKQIALESLQLKRYHLDQIEQDFPRARDRVYEMFVKWRKKNAGKATPKKLLELLEKREDVDDDALEILRSVIGSGGGST